MNILFWILQVLLALHTAMGALWKLSNSEQAVPSLKAIPHGAWMALSVVELACAAALLLPAVSRRLGTLAPIAAACIVAEMLVFSAVHLASGDGRSGELVYWIVVAALCGFIAYGRFVLKPLAS